ncbi:hypothetical protein ARMSODRAFT_963434 [Armillaria solidipes]|uniref:Uncharacterized protein n=1 Tax=Armillaria solidipes TaxID=1076256 RepID=A0A2H3BJH4_9AGAR|nr:hypothetical protein ARMSODRAFT_963434 [Armillaria solidipes]
MAIPRRCRQYNHINENPLTDSLISPEAPKMNPSYSVVSSGRIKWRNVVLLFATRSSHQGELAPC